MLFPDKGHLTASSTNKDCPQFTCLKTPSNKTGARVLKYTDYGMIGVGVGATVAAVFTGGLALPIIGGVATLYGLGRSTSEVVDKVTHEETLNPFTNMDAAVLWLGLAASLIGFSGTGSTMRLTAWAASGKEISAVFWIVLGTAKVSSFTAARSTMLTSMTRMLMQIDEASPEEVLYQVMSVAFWTQSILYKMNRFF
jgi:hypothetical protein